MKRAIILALVLFAAPAAQAAVGDAVTNCSSIAASAVLDAQPGSGVEWIIHNIWFEYNIEIQRYDGTNTVSTLQILGPDYVSFPAVHVTNSNRIRIKNLHGSAAKLICYDGIVTK